MERVANPSDQDLRAWTANLRRSSWRGWLGVIVSPSGELRSDADTFYTGFLLERGSRGKPACTVILCDLEPLEI
jgi:hypothetical protein